MSLYLVTRSPTTARAKSGTRRIAAFTGLALFPLLLVPGYVSYRGVVGSPDGEPGEQVAYWTRIVDHDPGNPEAHVHLADAHEEDDEWSLAIREYRGDARRQSGSPAEALKDYDQALTVGVRERDGWIYKHIAKAYDDMEDVDRAIENYQKAIELTSPDDDDEDLGNTYTSLGGAYMVKGNVDAAIDAYTTAIGMGSRYAYQQRAVAYGRKGERNRAIGDLDTLLQMDDLKPERRAEAEKLLRDLRSRAGT